MTKRTIFSAPILIMIFSIGVLTSCSTLKIAKHVGKETVHPTNYKTEFTFVYPKNDRLFIPVLFGKEQVARTCMIDNHSPSLLYHSIIQSTPGFTKVAKSESVSRNGVKTESNVYLTDSVMLGDVQFNHVLISGMPDKAADDRFKYDGVFGENLVTKSIWKIDFEHKLITLTNSIDSISGLDKATVIPVEVNSSGDFIIECTFPNNVKAKMDVDLGNSGSFALTKSTFDKIDALKQAKEAEGKATTAEGTQTLKRYTLENVLVSVGDRSLTTVIRSNDKITTDMVGLKYFASYKFIVLDYLNKKIYLSNEELK